MQITMFIQLQHTHYNCTYTFSMVSPCINGKKILYYPINALNYMNCRIVKTH